MSLRKRSLYSFILIIIILVVVFLFYAAGIHITGRIMRSRIEVGDLYKKWLLCKYEILGASFDKNKQEKLLKLNKRINDLDNALKHFENIPLFSAVGHLYPGMSDLMLKLQVEWSVTRIMLFKEIDYLKDSSSVTIDLVKKVNAELVSGSGPFERIFKSVLSWIDDYYAEQIKSFRMLFIFFGIILILSSFIILTATNLRVLQERLLLTAINSLSDGVVLTDARRRVIFINPGAEKLLHAGGGRIMNTYINENLILKSDYSNNPVRIDDSEKSNSSESILLTDKEGKTTPVSISITPLLNKGKVNIGSVYLIKDLTQWKRLVTKISSEFVTLEEEEIDREIDSILRRIAEVSGCSGVYIFQFSRNVENIIVTHKWEHDRLKNKWKTVSLRLENYRKFTEKLGSKDFIVLKESDYEDFFYLHGFEPLFMVPLKYSSVLIGFILAVSSVNTKIKTGEIRVCTDVMADMVVNLLERKWAAEELAHIGMEMQKLIENANAPIWGTDKNGLINVWNDKIEEISGYRKSGALNSKFTDYCADDISKDYFLKLIENSFLGRVDTDCEVRLKTDNGEEAVILFNTTPRKGRDGSITGVFFVGQNITRRKLAEIKIHKLTQELIRIQEDERKRVSMELHDNIAQELLTVRFSLEDLVRHKEKAVDIKNIKSLSLRIGELIESIRNISYNLHPAYLDQFGLKKALDILCRDFSARYGITVDFVATGLDNASAKMNTSIHLYRVIQEAFANILRHSQADNVALRIVASYPSAIFRIEDNGIGFDPDTILYENTEKHMGLRNMQERISLLGGKIDIMSKPGKGVKILIEVPLQAG